MIKRKQKFIFFFEQWGVRFYGNCNCFHIVLSTGVLLAINSIINIPAKAQEYQDTSKNIKTNLLEGVVVTAERTPVTAFRSGRVVNVITRDEIKNLPVQSIDGLLEYALSVDVRQRGANGVQSDISIRGGSFDQTLILLNGINICDPQTGHHNMNLPVDLDDISRVEILEGPGSRSFGANAFGGVINIITGEGKPQSAHLRFSAGDFGTYKGALNSTFHIGPSLNYFSASHQASKGYTANSDYSLTNFFYSTRIDIDPGRFDFQSGYSIRSFGANSFYSPKYTDQFEQTSTSFTSLRFTKNGTGNLSPYLYWRRNHDHYSLFRTQPPSWYKSDNYHMTDLIGGGINVTYSLGTGSITLGTDLRSERILSNILGELLRHPVDVPGKEGVQFTRAHTRYQAGTFIEYSIAVNRFYVSAGTMLAYSSDNLKQFSFNPGLDIGYQVSKTLRWFISANRALRLPTFTDLYYSSPVQSGNPDLLPEKAIALESGVKFFRKGFTGHLSLFRRWGSDIIDWVKYPYDSIWISMNHTRVNINGLEIAMQWKPGAAVNKRILVRSIQLSYSYLDPEKESRGMQSKYVLDPLRHKIDLGIDHRIFGGFNASWRLSYQQRAGGFQPFENNQYLPEVPYPTVLLLDGRIYLEYHATTIYAEATNILNIIYTDNANVPEPGRWFKAGIMADIQWRKR